MNDESGPDNDGKQINGHKPTGLRVVENTSDLFSGTDEGQDRFAFDVDAALAAVVRLHAEVPSDAYTAHLLGAEREGNGIVIDDAGLILTIGYLVVEAHVVVVEALDGQMVPAEVVAYDFDSGFGLVRAQGPLLRRPLEFGNSADLQLNTPALVAGHGGRSGAIGALVVSKREFAGYWEYMLDEAIFTVPPHPNWGGTALIGQDGKLLGVGSLYVEDARQGEEQIAGNMFVPIDLLKPILSELLSEGKTSTPPRPWLGIFTAENQGRVEVIALAENGPADRSGIKQGDVVVKVNGAVVTTVSELYRRMWAVGKAGVKIPIIVLRGNIAIPLEVPSIDRADNLRLEKGRS
jgi:S1-C subfamily serine protease